MLVIEGEGILTRLFAEGLVVLVWSPSAVVNAVFSLLRFDVTLSLLVEILDCEENRFTLLAEPSGNGGCSCEGASSVVDLFFLNMLRRFFDLLLPFSPTFASPTAAAVSFPLLLASLLASRRFVVEERGVTCRLGARLPNGVLRADLGSLVKPCSSCSGLCMDICITLRRGPIP